MKIFLDTSGLLSVFDRADSHHQLCKSFWTDSLLREWKPVTSDYVLDELTTLIAYKIGADIAHEVLTKLLTLGDSRTLDIIWVNASYFQKAKDILKKHNDHSFSFTDCTSFAICSDLNISSSFAIDADFKRYGLDVFPKP